MSDTPEIPPGVQENIARAKWRADLLRMAAGGMTSLAEANPDNPLAQDLGRQASGKEAEAALHEMNAQLEQDLAVAKSAFHADPKDAAKRQAYERAAQAITDARALWRGIGEVTGTRVGILRVDDFPEPPVDEVLASHGGAV